MDQNQLYLFKDKRFLPIFIVQFCGCLNDSILKNALIILVTYTLSNQLIYSPQILVLIANTLFILPFIVFSSLAGQIADRYERSTIVKIIKFCELAIVAFAIYGFKHNNLIVLFSCITLMGIHSTFFGPIKYSVLPDHLKKNELLGANGFVEAGTFLSILIGTIIGGFYSFSSFLIIFIASVISLIGFVTSFFLPKSNNSNQEIKINLNLWSETLNIIKYAYSKKQVYLAILGISWFWFIGAAILSQLPSLTKDILGSDENVANLFLATFSIGVGVGSFLCSKILKNEISTKYLFISALGLSLFGIDLCFASRISAVHYEPEQLKSIFVFLLKKHNWRILLDLFCLSAIGGIYVVPLFAILQFHSSVKHRSRVIAANNLINSIFMVASAGAVSVLFYLGYTIPFVIFLVSIFNLVVAFYIYKLLPDTKIIPLWFLRGIFKILFDSFYKVEVKGIENFYKAGKRSIIVANHLSYLDPALIATYLPEEIIFAINTDVSQQFFVRPFLKIVKTLPIDPNNPMAIKTLIDKVKKSKKVAIFPEGRISTTGALMKIYEGPGMIADKADATILPIRVEGTQFTHFSRLKNILKTKLFPKVTITILPPIKLSPPSDLDNRLRRKYLSKAMYDIMSEMIFETSGYKKTLFQSLIEASKIHGSSSLIMQDIDNNSVTYRELLMKSFILAELISKNTQEGQYVGLMLPNMVATAITFYAMQSIMRVPTMINFTAGSNAIVSGCNTVGVKVVYTSKKFIKKAELGDIIKKLIENSVSIIYLEDLRSNVTFRLKIKALVGSFFPQSYYNNLNFGQDDKKPAVILFTSGTEGHPKAVVLSHRNIQANRCQVMARVDFSPQDIAFNALPMFHCFGLTGAIIMSLAGIRTFFYPSPLHYRVIPETVYDISATIMFTTDTFLNGYAKYANPYDFHSMRYVFAGAEKLKNKTRQLWFDKYGVRIFEGYGVTEASPVIAANTSMYHNNESVGRLMPKMEYFIQAVEGINEGGRLHVKGPNVMLGYIRAENPKVIEKTYDEKLGEGWYDTGDIASIDEDGYLTLLGRAKRFAKIAGEMVSLMVVEDIASKVDIENMHAAVSISDEKKGEQILLFTNGKDLTKEQLAKAVKEMGMSELYIPKFVLNLDEMPILSTGKINYREILEIAEKRLKLL